MQDIANHRLSVAAMGAVTGSTVAQFGREVGMFLLNRGQRMTAKAERLGILDQQGRIGRLVRLMAGVALPVGEGSVGMLELSGQIGVTSETGIRQTFLEQSRKIRGMGIMTRQALSLAHRLMHPPLAVFLGRLFMAGVTQDVHLFLKQSRVPGHMGAVAGLAIPFGSRKMFHPFLENGPVVTFKTIDSRSGHSLNRKEQKQRCNRGQYES